MLCAVPSRVSSMASPENCNQSVALSSLCCLRSSSLPSASGCSRCWAPSAGPNSSCFSFWHASPPRGLASRRSAGPPSTPSLRRWGYSTLMRMTSTRRLIAWPRSRNTLRMRSIVGRYSSGAVLLRLSLSRLNHRLPRGQTDPEVMQGTAQFHHEIADAVLPQPDPVFHDAAALDAAVDMLDPQPTVMQGLVGQLLLPGEALATGLLRRHEDRHLRERERQETQILQEPAPRRQGIRRRVRHGRIMGAATIGVAQKEDEEQGIDQQDIFDGMVLFLERAGERLRSIQVPAFQFGEQELSFFLNGLCA